MTRVERAFESSRFLTSLPALLWKVEVDFSHLCGVSACGKVASFWFRIDFRFFENLKVIVINW